MTLSFNETNFKQSLEKELTGNVLPFWMTHVIDKENGGFYGAVTNDCQPLNDVPRSAVFCARMLWTFSAAYRKFHQKAYLDTARWAYDYLTGPFWDEQYDGLYWQIDKYGKTILDRKHHYGQAFGIYGLSEYYSATQDPKALALAQKLFTLLEKYAFDHRHFGYIEASTRAWDSLDDMRLSAKEDNCRKSMNTMLHILEAYTNLLRVWDDPQLRAQHKALVQIFQKRIVDPLTGHFKLFFNDEWQVLSSKFSYGHDVEGSWLLYEGAQMHSDPDLLRSVRKTAITLARAVCRDGLDEDGSVFYEGHPKGVLDGTKVWWAHSEAMLGFYNAYQLSGESDFAEAAYRCWSYIQEKFIDRQNGDWFRDLTRDGKPYLNRYKAGPWDCPYHHTRACLEMMERLAA